MRAIYVSVYSGEISIEQWQKIKSDGYELVVVGLFHGRTVNRFAGQQLSGAIQTGLKVAADVLIAPWTGWTGAQQVAAGMAEAQAHKDKLRFVEVDVEIDGVTGKMIRDALDTVKELGQRPIIYTGRWWWVYHFGDSQVFKDFPLCAAQYPSFLPDEPENLLGWVTLFGGWTRENLVGWQYTNTTQLHGVNVCKEWFDSEWVMEGKEEMLEERVKKVERGLELEREKQGIRASTEAFLATFGGTDAAHSAAFWNLIEKHYAWRLLSNGWSRPG